MFDVLNSACVQGSTQTTPVNIFYSRKCLVGRRVMLFELFENVEFLGAVVTPELPLGGPVLGHM